MRFSLFAFALLAATPAASPQNVPACLAVHLEPFTDDGGCQMGRCYTLLALRNIGTAACSLPEHMDLTTLNAQGMVMQRKPLQSSQTTVLAPEEFAQFESVSGEEHLRRAICGSPLPSTHAPTCLGW